MAFSGCSAFARLFPWPWTRSCYEQPAWGIFQSYLSRERSRWLSTEERHNGELYSAVSLTPLNCHKRFWNSWFLANGHSDLQCLCINLSSTLYSIFIYCSLIDRSIHLSIYPSIHLSTYLLVSIIFHHHLSLSCIIYDSLSLSTSFHHLLSSFIIFHHLCSLYLNHHSWSSIIYHQSWSIIICHQRLPHILSSFAIIYL